MSTVSLEPPYEKAVRPTVRECARLPEEFECKICHHQLLDPRVLPCFHCFCLSCLQNCHDKQTLSKADSLSPLLDAAEVGNVSGRFSRVSGYESELAAATATDQGWKQEKGQSLECPQCGIVCQLPIAGLSALPPNFVLQHRMLLASLNQDSVCFYCDLCSIDIPATVRCTQCLMNLCQLCCEGHRRQRVSAEHELLNLSEVGRQSAVGVSAVRRQIMCASHPDKELTLYCSECQEPICRDCCVFLHRGHPCDVVQRAAKKYSTMLRECVEKSKLAQKEAKLSQDKLHILSQRVEMLCNQIDVEVDQFIDSYMKAIEEHARQLHAAVAEAKKTKLQVLSHHQQELSSSLTNADIALKFGEDLLAEGSDSEVLSFAARLVAKLDDTLKAGDNSFLPDLKVLETVNFLPDEKSAVILNKQLYGMITTQRVSAQHSTLKSEGLGALNNARQQQTSVVILSTRDTEGQPICHGGEQVDAELRYRDLSRRCIPVTVKDKQDGSYAISFTPDAAGNMILSVTIRGHSIKGSPFPVCVRTLRAHHGTFHCCSFCSSGGRKDAVCGCGGTMPGGFTGCGHGHPGHPGRRHWSCCGNTLHNSECGRPPPTLYHFSL